MDGRMILYRGSLKSCNYRCSYCPFSKRPVSDRELERDQEQWISFVRTFKERAAALNVRALMVAPYGEALIHPWYWEGMAHLSAEPGMDAVGAQTNLSFPVGETIAAFLKEGGVPGKLRIWATFHPEMTTVSRFAEAVRELKKTGAAVCAGAVAVPEHLGLLRQLARELPEEASLWLNRMDGLKRPYTEGERQAFLEIDPCFLRELAPVPADPARCVGRLFVEGDGRLRTCNIGPVLDARWESVTAQFPPPRCSRKYCSCYLAYGGREDFMNRALFGAYPLFRMPRRVKAAFFDIDGTLIRGGKSAGRRPSSKGCISAEAMAGLEALSGGKTELFFATALPYKEAAARCRKVRHLFSGGVFAGGAHILLAEKGKKREYFYFLEEACVLELKRQEKAFHFRILALRSEGRLYKITLLRPSKKTWKSHEAEAVFETLPALCRDGLRYFTEENCMQIVAVNADKEAGVRTLCRWMNLSPEDIFAAGDSEEDEGMMRFGGWEGRHEISAGHGGRVSAGF